MNMLDAMEKIDIGATKLRVNAVFFSLLLLFFAVAPLRGQERSADETETAPPFDATTLHPDMAWDSSGEEIVRLRALCWSEDAHSARARVPAAMSELGAGPQPVALARALGDGRYLRFMDSTGIPRRIILHEPLGAHDQHSLYLLGSDGNALNVDDDLSQVKGQRARDGGWVQLQQRYPKLAMHPADRSPDHLPRVEKLRGGRTRVIVQYRLTDGCRACARVGFAEVGYYYETDGSFLAQKFLGVFRQPAARPVDTPADCAR